MLLVNNKGRVVDVSQDLAKELLANRAEFEIYDGQTTSRFGRKVYGHETLNTESIKVNLEDNKDFNPSTIQHIDPKNKRGFPVAGSHTAQEEAESKDKDDEINELKKMLRQTMEVKAPEAKPVDTIECRGCGKSFTPPTKAHKYCQKCKDERKQK